MGFPRRLSCAEKKAAILFSPGIVFVPAILAGLMWRDVRFADGSLNLKLTGLAYAFGILHLCLVWLRLSISFGRNTFAIAARCRDSNLARFCGRWSLRLL